MHLLYSGSFSTQVIKVILFSSVSYCPFAFPPPRVTRKGPDPAGESGPFVTQEDGSGSLVLQVVGNAELVEDVEQQAHEHPDDAREHHALELDVAEVDGDAGEARHEDDGGERLIAGAVKVDLRVDENPQAGHADHTVEQERDAADDGAGNRRNKSRELADERADDGQHGSAADDPHAVDLRHRHDADVLAVRRRRDGADQAGDGGGNVVAEQRAVQAGILEQVAADNLARHDLVADMFGRDDQEDRHHREDGVHLKLRELEVRQRDDTGVVDGGEIDKAEDGGENIARDNRNQHGNHAEEPAEQDRAEDGDTERHKEDSQSAHIDALPGAGQQAGGVGGAARELEANQRDDRAHRGGRQDDVNPAGAELVDDERQHAAENADDNEAALRVGERLHVLGNLLSSRIVRQILRWILKEIRGTMLLHH